MICEDGLAQMIGVITFVGDDGTGLEAVDQCMRLGDVVALTWAEQQTYGITECVGSGMYLGAQPAA